MKTLAPPRFLLFVGVLIAAAAALLQLMPRTMAVMASFDIAAAAFLLSCIPLLNDDAGQMRKDSRDNDANRAVLLAVSVAATIVVLVAVGDVIGGGRLHLADRALIVATLVLAWLFGNVVYALHYAHLYYRATKGGRGDSGGIDFPGTKEPDYWDFVYFAFTLGMTFQTSDSDISSKPIRRVAIGHCMAAFTFNLGVLAFTINLLASSSGK